MQADREDSERVPTQFAGSLLRMLLDRGVDPRQTLAAAGIDFDVLDPLAPGYRSEIAALSYSNLYRAVLSALQDETFGLRRDVGMNPGAFRMMCYCVLGCGNLGRAIARIGDFHRVFLAGKLAMNLRRDGETALVEVIVWPEAQRDPGQPLTAVESACCLSMWHRFFGWLIGHPLPLESVSLSGDAPPSLQRYHQLFNSALQFSSATPSLRFPAEYLDYPLVHNEDSLREFLRTAPYQLLTMPADSGKQSLVDQVRALIGHDFSRGFPSFERITDLLHMSAPTLRRRLKREGTTFQELKDNCRRDASIAYLNRPELSINDVAILMGFTDPSAFYRSFKKWTGMTPGEFRALESR
jgi:AraC-like DNA-binding protein